MDDAFDPVTLDGPFAKTNLDPAEIARLEDLVTRGWRRLKKVRELGLPISAYPLVKAEG
jgi:hypothetical protein